MRAHELGGQRGKVDRLKECLQIYLGKEYISKFSVDESRRGLGDDMVT